MIVDVIMPKLGESITEGTIIQWRKAVGEVVEKDEILLEIGTDKVDSEIPSPAAGVLKEILGKPNNVFPVNEVIARIETDESLPAENPLHNKEVTIDSSTSLASDIAIAPSSKTPDVSPIASNGGQRTFYTPLVRAIARREGVLDSELASISGTGSAGRVTKGDIISYIETRGIPEAVHAEKPTSIVPVMTMDDRVEEMGRMRQKIAQHMRNSIDTAAHVYLVSECDVTNVVEYVNSQKKDFLDREGFKLTYTPFFVLAAVKAIEAHPNFNASLDDIKIVHKKNINIGIAVAMDKGLMVPVIPNCEELNFLGLCRKVSDLTVRGRNGQISPDELQGSTFSISNYGVFGTVFGMPIINQPNSAILGIGAIKKQPVVRETSDGDAIVIRSICYISIGIDHRLLDGSDGGLFLKTMVDSLERLNISTLL